MRSFDLSNHTNYIVTANNWIQTGNTHSTCYKMLDGRIRVTFTGTYGGADGQPGGVNELVVYGFYIIDACQQSPVIIQYQSSTPLRVELVDGTGIINCALYNRVLGHGKAQGIGTIKRDPDEPNDSVLLSEMPSHYQLCEHSSMHCTVVTTNFSCSYMYVCCIHTLTLLCYLRVLNGFSLCMYALLFYIVHQFTIA